VTNDQKAARYDVLRARYAQIEEVMTYEHAESLAPECDYAFEATHTDENPIHWPDAVAFYLEGYHRALKDLKGAI
jgi:hypothetical protein